jgi:hypothetical protein
LWFIKNKIKGKKKNNKWTRMDQDKLIEVLEAMVLAFAITYLVDAIYDAYKGSTEQKV